MSKYTYYEWHGKTGNKLGAGWIKEGVRPILGNAVMLLDENGKAKTPEDFENARTTKTPQIS